MLKENTEDSNVAYRIPDFVVFGGSEADNRYIEYLGMRDNDDYDRKWTLKLNAYHATGITTEGGPNGKLIVIDDRGDQEYWKDDVKMREKLRNVISFV